MSTLDKFRLITRSDFDGLVCAVLLKDLDLIDDILFVHPKDMQDGKIEVDRWDILTNLPYVPGCHMAFDHHSSEKVRLAQTEADNYFINPDAPSAARVVYDHFGGAEAFPRVSAEMMREVDKCDSAQYTREEILHPSGWVLLGFLMDARTGLGRFRNFRISNYQLMMNLVDMCLKLEIEDILDSADVHERVEVYLEHADEFKAQLERCSKVHGDLVVLDLRHEETIYSGNRFMIYALHPQCELSVHVLWGRKQRNTVFAIGKSIINRSSDCNIGALCLEYGGGGHHNAGTCQVPNDEAEKTLAEIIERVSVSVSDQAIHRSKTAAA